MDKQLAFVSLCSANPFSRKPGQFGRAACRRPSPACRFFIRTRSIAVLAGSVVTLAMLSGTAPDVQVQDGIRDDAAQVQQQTIWSDLIAASRPVAAHEPLGDLVGSWTVKSIFTPGPGSQPLVSTGSAEAQWVIGGRFLQVSSNLTHEGVKSESLVHLGFDTRHKQYTLHAIDSFGTFATDAAGAYDAATRTFTLRGKLEEPTPIADEPWRTYEFEIQIEVVGGAVAGGEGQEAGGSTESKAERRGPTLWRQTNRVKLPNDKWFTSTVIEYRRGE